MKLPLIHQSTVEGFKKLFPKGKVVRCKKFNRRSCWERLDINRWFESIRKGANINPLIYICIKSCMEYCRKLGKDEDYKYYATYKSDGYKYITIEGGNRHDATHDFYDENKVYREDKHVNYCIIESVDRETMHDLYCRLAYGKAPNRQEQRTGIFGKVSDLVRKKAQLLGVMWENLGGIKRERMQDDEFVTQVMSYATYGTLSTADGYSTKDDTFDGLYKDNKYKSKRFNHIIKELKNIFECVPSNDTITRKLKKTFGYLLVMTLGEFHTRYSIEDYDDFLRNFKEIYDGKMSSDDKLYKAKRGELTWNGLMGGIGRDDLQLDFVKSLLNEDFFPALEKQGIITPKNEEEFTYSHRRDYITEHKEERGEDHLNKYWIKIRSNNKELTLVPGEPEFKYVSLSEAYSSKCELDHIDPKSKGGPTILENAELTTKEYNRAKSDKQNV